MPVRDSAAAAAVAEKRWGPYRAARLAAGLPPTKSVGEGRMTRYLPAGSAAELHWVAKGIELGLIAEDEQRNRARRIAKQLRDEHTKVAIRRTREAPVANPLPVDDDLLLDYLRNEAVAQRARAQRDREIAEQHDRMADEAEAALVAAMRRLGVVS